MEQTVLVCTGICATTAVLLWGAVTFYKRATKALEKAQTNWSGAASCLEGMVKARNEACEILNQAEAIRDSLPTATVLPFKPRLVTSSPTGGAA